ncbi:UDP-2,3-diacylglucosamine diphosphatase [Phytohalomonas tamaricis]|uniref:UDP-2,3-diacylglucosamine diphosphatase n=1 Tax=Phytohalomonas tamaricis TaxID=2081032 RepID=UPI000D0B93DE|nr:UDP-2,3-diacylglucosamine diphosphatase [Phytohalomonas tamaricis]
MALTDDDVRTLFISDIHLGTRDAQATLLMQLLHRFQPERLYLVGDVFDLIAMRRRAVLTSAQQSLVSYFLQMAESGCEVIYIPGNHDAAFRRLCGLQMHNVRIEQEMVHTLKDGRRLLVSHGDEFDDQMHVAVSPWLHAFGSQAFKVMRWINRQGVQLRDALGLSYWSLASAIKQRSGIAQRYVARFEGFGLERARQENYDGYVCGHIHQAGFRVADGILYCNDGDWVEHCTALVETQDGKLHLIDWRGEILMTAPSIEAGSSATHVSARGDMVDV